MFPFKIGTTSFIYPDTYVQNVKMLAPYLDEVELIFFESVPDSLPSHPEIQELLLLAKEHDLSYNVHFPLDISLGAPDPSARHFSLETIKQIMDLTTSLSPSTYTLHLPYQEPECDKKHIKRWKERIYNSMEKLLSTGINSRILSIETLQYPLEWVEDILIDFNLSVCIDIGHLILNGFDMASLFNTYEKRTSILHLHGVGHHRDHQSLDRLTKEDMENVFDMLKRFTGVVSIEVFSYNLLKASLNFLEKYWQDSNPPERR